jgi:hypothetical protein
MPIRGAFVATAATAAALSGCSAGHDISAVSPSTERAALTASTAGAGMHSAIPEISQVITITDANDGNHMIGRAGGYTGAVVFIDTRTKHDDTSEQCDINSPGVDACGAAVEEWPSAGRRRTAQDLHHQRHEKHADARARMANHTRQPAVTSRGPAPTNCCDPILPGIFETPVRATTTATR